jgi:serine protease Do
MNNAPLLQVIMKTLPGGSGSPVFDGEGKLVAMVKGRYRGTDIVGFLTPLDIMRQFLDER